jgi:peptidyl-prolyl cis-trans isomerase B (cyclophilin B)
MRRLRRIAAALVVALGCSEAERVEEAAPKPPPTPPIPDAEMAMIDVAGFGEIRLELYSDKAPATVANFKKLAREGFYDGTTFHRVKPGFMIQGGDPNSRDRDPRNDGKGGPGYTIPDEFNDVSLVRGVVAMARRKAPNSAGSQFFIVRTDASRLDGRYTAFGRVVAGLEVVDAIAAVERDKFGRWGPRDRPLENVVMRTVRIEPREPAQDGAGTAGAATSPAPADD